MLITQEYNIDVSPFGAPVVIPVSQSDTGSRALNFHLFDRKTGEKVSIPTGSAVYIGGTKPDGKAFSYECSWSSGGDVSTNVTEQMTAVAGYVECELSIYKDQTRLATSNFKLHVEPSALDEDKISDSDLNVIPTLVTEAIGSAKNSADMAKRSENAAQRSASAAQASQNAASQSATDANSAKNSAEQARSDSAASASSAATSERNAKSSADAAAASEKNAMSATPDGYSTLAATFNALGLYVDSEGYVCHAIGEEKQD